MGFFSKLFGGSSELLIPCQNHDCKKVFRESEGMNQRRDTAASGLFNYKCPFCSEEFAVNKSKLPSMQKKLKQRYKTQAVSA